MKQSTRDKIGCRLANRLFWKLPALPGKVTDQMALVYIGVFNECGVYLQWNRREERFEINRRAGSRLNLSNP